jgi:hypothetical protein
MRTKIAGGLLLLLMLDPGTGVELLSAQVEQRSLRDGETIRGGFSFSHVPFCALPVVMCQKHGTDGKKKRKESPSEE